jgi:hypothetical protein
MRYPLANMSGWQLGAEVAYRKTRVAEKSSYGNLTQQRGEAMPHSRRFSGKAMKVGQTGEAETRKKEGGMPRGWVLT